MLDLAELDSTWCEQSDPEIEAWDLRGTRSGVRITVDEGVYLGSVPTMYRILREETLTGEHRRCAVPGVFRFGVLLGVRLSIPPGR